MKKEKVIEVNLGVGMNMFFPETVKIVIEDEDNNRSIKKQIRKSSKVNPEIEIEKE